MVEAVRQVPRLTQLNGVLHSEWPLVPEGYEPLSSTPVRFLVHGLDEGRNLSLLRVQNPVDHNIAVPTARINTLLFGPRLAGGCCA